MTLQRGEDMRLSGKLAIITGSSRGIGLSIATSFVKEGAKVVICSRKKDNIENAAETLREIYPNQIFPYVLNTSHIESLEVFVKKVSDTHGVPDILVNNAAANPYFGPLMGLEWSAFDKTVAVNLKGPLELSRRLVQLYTQKTLKNNENVTQLSITHISSIFGLAAAPLQGVYGMTKAALISLTKTMSHEWGSLGVRVNCIAPGLVDTHFASALISNKGLTEKYNERSALGRYGTPDEISEMAVYLASDTSRYVTGQTFIVDGGYSVG